MKPARSLILLAACVAAFATESTADPSTFWQASLAAENQKNYDQALKDAYNFQAEGGDRYLAAVRCGWLLFQKGDLTKSAGFYEAASKQAPSALAPYLGLAKIAYAQSDWKRVVSCCAQALRFDAGNYTALLLSADAYYKLNDYAAAIHYAQPLMNFYPDDPAPASIAAWSYLNKRDKRMAEILFKRVLLLSPDYSYAKQGLEICRAGKP